MTSPLYFELGQANMVDIGDGQLPLGLLPLRKAVVPANIELSDDNLLWLTELDEDQDDEFKDGFKEVDPRGMLGAFIRIRDKQGVLRFAQRYGVLWLCFHGLPASHNPKPYIAQSSTYSDWCEPVLHDDGYHYFEPIWLWLYYVEKAKAILSIAAALHQGKPGREQDWVSAYQPLYPNEEVIQQINGNVQILKNSVEYGRPALSRIILEWVDYSHSQPILNWGVDGAQPLFELECNTFGFLIVQILAAITQTQGLAVCNGCSYPYMRKNRKPQTGRHNYCPLCREQGIPNRNDQRRHRLKKPLEKTEH